MATADLGFRAFKGSHLMEMNKIFAAVLLAGIVAMGTGFLAELLLYPEELETAAYSIDTGAEAAEAPAEEEESLPPIEPLLASADVGAGQDATRACAACHSFEEGGPNKVGPNLWNVVGGPIAHLDNFNYSGTLQEMHDEGDEWTFEALNGFLAAPRDWAPGTTMSYAGVRNEQDRANIIAYMNSMSPDPLPLPE